MSQILDDNFDSYTLGVTTPFGPWTGTGLIIQPGTPPSAAPPGKACAVGQVFAPVTTVASGVLSWSMAMGDTNLNGVPMIFLIAKSNICISFSLRDLECSRSLNVGSSATDIYVMERIYLYLAAYCIQS